MIGRVLNEEDFADKFPFKQMREEEEERLRREEEAKQRAREEQKVAQM